MAQQDKTDWYWNGVLAGAVNNLYYDFINVDVVHVPYTTTHRNSSFFLQTRMNYTPSYKWEKNLDMDHRSWDVVDVKYVWNDTCSKERGWVYVLLADSGRSKMRIHAAKIEDGCVQNFDWNRTRGHEFTVTGCGDFRLFTTDYVRGKRITPWESMKEIDGEKAEGNGEKFTGIQINRYEGGMTHGYFSDINVRNGVGEYIMRGSNPDDLDEGVGIGDYILVYEVDQPGKEGHGFAGQVRMIVGIEDGELVLDEPWQGFKTLSGEDDEKKVEGKGVSYYIFKDGNLGDGDERASAWGEVVGLTDGREVYIVNSIDASEPPISVYNQTGIGYTNIISVAEALGKIYILTDNGYIHYSNYSGFDKFFVQDDLLAGVDKTSIISYRDLIIAFGNRHIAVGVPDETNTYTSMYNQSATVGLRSRYSYAEYDGDLVFVSNDKRLLALGIASNTGKYMLQYEDVGDSINSKLTILTPGDEVFVGSDDNDLRIFIQTKSMPFYNDDGDWQAHLTNPTRVYDSVGHGTENKYQQENTMTRIIKFDKMFKVWTEDWVQGILLQGVEGGIYFGQNGLYQRARGTKDYRGDGVGNDGEGYSYGFKSYISAYLIENESDWAGGTNSWLANRPKLYNISKLNRLITTLGPGVYSHNTKIRVTSYVKGLGSVYEFSIDGGSNDWLGLITTKYLGETLDADEEKKLECLNSVLQDSQKAYQPKCTGIPNAAVQNSVQQQPWCDTYTELLTWDRGVCIDDSLYELAPSMPLVTDLGENQDYSTQIKLELIGGEGDIITFGGWLGEMFVAPLFTKGPDGEYQLQPNTDC